MFVVILFGAVVGSFLNVVILRLPEEGASIVFPGSHCPVCKTALRWYDNIPIISYCLIRGKCRSCKTSISLQYPVVEVCMALLSAALYVRFALSFDFLYYFFFIACLLVIIFIDIHHQIIPDVISLPGIVAGGVGSFFCTYLTWQESIIGILAGGGVLYLIAFCYYAITRRDGMGGGDIKLLAMIGAFLGWPSLLYVVFFSSLTGSIVGIATMISKKESTRLKIPFGPFLSLGGLSYLFFKPQIMYWWQQYIEIMAR
ncbi:prepilin peptidase [Desulfogranum marinum]|uniref:prepilin peptidase n=1 Tax=Desulfogranum marinum TaxID=453220 RepID=UPI001E640D08|nr:A24 family peptidase [Desulfogranum marinum]